MSLEPVRVEVTRTKADYFWAVLFNTLRQWSTWVSYILASLFIAVLAFAGADHQPATARWLTALAAFVLIFTLFLATLLATAWFLAMKNWGAPGAFAPISFSLAPGGLSVAHETGVGETKWLVWRSFFETGSLIVIRHKLGFVQIIPKRGLDADMLARVRAMLSAQLGPARATTETAS